MSFKTKSIRAFIGAKDYNLSREFYLDLGFQEVKTSAKMSYFSIDNFGFYLQNYFAKDWVDNTMLFLEVINLETQLEKLKELKLDTKYSNIRISEIQYNDWGNEFFLYDPSGILWHIGEFKN